MRIKDEQAMAARRQYIMDETRKLLVRDGIEQVSIRKIAEQIHQTPGIIYHYFKDKDELLVAIVQEGYTKILENIAKHKRLSSSCEEQLITTLKSYIREMRKQAELYKIIMQSSNPAIKAQTEIMRKGIRSERKSMDQLCQCLEAGVECGLFRILNIELRGQCIWASVYGLLERLILEQVEEKQQEKLIDELMEMILQSIKK